MTQSGWSRIRKQMPSKLAEAADFVVEIGGLSLLDIQAMEYADHLFLTNLMNKAIAEERSGAFVERVMSARLQSRKHLRTLAHLMNPSNNVGETHPVVADEIADKYSHQVVDDFGDDLIN
jgi:hypothetical protein